ncbi:ribonuclease M5 [Streptococcus sp. sy010]|uniref:ribonuclease M5 n=1 Tax=Streptococcus sp. sy010 TaxID=2600148 RepID=UPI0011B601B8|nr:ribonuclease M5 [Streptococcus sp. sy010]TWT14446.1 ribonuclease M5 [Streptococcus sp. sy010]
MTNKIKIQEVIVVEGRDDTVNLKRFYDVDTYETRGSAINVEDIERIKKLHEHRGVIVLTDPDYQGERIRRMITQAIPTVKHAFVNPDEAVPESKSKGRSLGVEHANFIDLEKALHGLRGQGQKTRSFNISQTDLIRLGLLMGADSRQRREYLGQNLRIGYCNGKQLLKRLELFGVNLQEVEKCMKDYERKRDENSRLFSN